MSGSHLPVDQIMQTIRDNRSSESNFAVLQQELAKTIATAQQVGNDELITRLQEVQGKYVAEYKKAQETGGSAWPEFEKFVTQFERVLTDAKNGG